MRKILSVSWSWQEFIEFLSAYSDTLYDKHKIKTSWADERIEDEGYGMNNEWQTGQIKVPRGQSSREDRSLIQVKPSFGHAWSDAIFDPSEAFFSV